MDEQFLECIECGATFCERDRGELDFVVRFKQHVKRQHKRVLHALDGNYLYLLTRESERRLAAHHLPRLHVPG